MKNILLPICTLLFFLSCNSHITLISKTKQTIYPGVRTQKTYIKYIVKFSVNTNEVISIDSIYINKEAHFYKVKNYLIKEEKSTSYTEKIINNGIYILEISLKENNASTIQKHSHPKREVTVYYQHGNIAKSMILNDFIEEYKTKR